MQVHSTSVPLRSLLSEADISSEVSGNPMVEGLAYDSRLIRKGDLFFAVPGINVDGRDFIREAAKKGAVAAIAEKRVPLSPIPIVEVKSVLETMSRLSHIFYGKPSEDFPVLGVTGTNGKTTVTYIVEKICQVAGKRCGVMGTIDYRFESTVIPAPNTTPMSAEIHHFIRALIEKKADLLVMEVSSHALELFRVQDVTFFSGVFTNLTQDHLDFHSTMEAYFNAKARLFQENPGMRPVINIDDEYGQRLYRDFPKATTFGFNEMASIQAKDPVCDLGGIRFQLKMPSGHWFDISTNLIGRHNVSNMMASAGLATTIGISEVDIVHGLNQDHRIPGRLERLDSKNGFVAVVDYAHTPDALEKVLISLREVSSRKLVCVFGAGGDRDRKKRPLMGKIAVSKADYVVLTSDNPRTENPRTILSDIEEGISESGKKNYCVIENRMDAIAFAIGQAKAGDIVCIAGKGHENYQIYGKKKHYFSDVEAAREALSLWK